MTRAFLNLALIGYILLWFVLLIYCIKQREFFPVFGHGWGTKVFWLITFIFFNPILTLLYFLFGVLARPAERATAFRTASAVVPVLLVILLFEMPPFWKRPAPIVMERNAQGEMVRNPKRSERFRFQASIFAARSNLGTTTVRTGSSNARLAGRRIALVNQSSHSLMAKVGEQLQEELAAASFVEQIVYYPHGASLPRGARAPDCVILLQMPQIKESRWPLYRSILATVTATAGPQSLSGYTLVHDNLTPPIVTYNWTADLTHQSRLIGYESARAKYGQAAKSIAKSLGESLVKTLTDYQKEHGLLAELPASFYGPYHDPTPPDFLPGKAAEVVPPASAMFRHCRAFWLFADDRDATTVLGSIQRQAERDGWKLERREPAAEISMAKGGQRLVVFRKPEIFSASTFVTVADANGAKARKFWAVFYEEVFTDDEIQKALNDLLASNCAPDDLIVFREFFDRGPLKDAFAERLTQGPVRTFEGQIALARFHLSKGQKDQARNALLRARALAMVISTAPAELDRRIEDLAKEIGDEPLAKAPLPQSIWKEAGFVELTGGRALSKNDLALGEPALFYYQTKEGRIGTASVHVERGGSEKSRTPYTLHVLVRDGGGGRAWTSSPGSARPNWSADVGAAGAGVYVHAKAEALAQERFRLTVDSPYGTKAEADPTTPGFNPQP